MDDVLPMPAGEARQTLTSGLGGWRRRLVELLPGGSRLLSVTGLTVSPTPAELAQPSHPFHDEFAKGRGIYTIRMTISAGLRSERDLVAGNCKPPSDVDANMNFCAVDTFEFTARLGGSNG